MAGLQGLSTLAAAVVDGVEVPWIVTGEGASAAVDLMKRCLEDDPRSRPPSMQDVQDSLLEMVWQQRLQHAPAASP
jgi:hypothetical protein